MIVTPPPQCVPHQCDVILSLRLLMMMQISGQLPATWKSLTQLQKLVLNNNNLSGPVPTGWKQLQQLQAVYTFNNTALSGCLPASWRAQLPRDFDAAFFLWGGTRLRGFCKTS